MSIWTHVLGLVRYDSITQNVWPEPKNKGNTVAEELEVIRNFYSNNIPEGSEGPLQVDFFLANRGPIVVITGDLRDFAIPQVSGIVKWLNDCYAEALEYIKKHHFMLHLRDSCISCTVEPDKIILISSEIDTFFSDDGLIFQARLL